MHAHGAGADDAVLIACPACHTLVRIPQSRLGDKPVCARCKSPVLNANVVELDAASFAAHVERSTQPVLVDFWAPWCGPCRMMAPMLERIADESRTRLQVAKVNTDAEPEIAGRFGIRSIPTLILFRKGREVARQSGATDLGSLKRWIDGALNTDGG
jgi:thioredoxin 2